MKITMNAKYTEKLGSTLKLTDIIQTSDGVGVVIKESNKNNNTIDVLSLIGDRQINSYTDDTHFMLYEDAELIIRK